MRIVKFIEKPKINIKFLPRGRYGFVAAVFTDLQTGGRVEMRIEDFVRDFRMLELWEVLFGFALDIDGDTEYARRADGTRCVMKGCLAYEIADDNTLKLHFPRWDAPDGRSYDVAAVYGYAPPFCQRKL